MDSNLYSKADTLFKSDALPNAPRKHVLRVEISLYLSSILLKSFLVGGTIERLLIPSKWSNAILS